MKNNYKLFVFILAILFLFCTNKKENSEHMNNETVEHQHNEDEHKEEENNEELVKHLDIETAIAEYRPVELSINVPGEIIPNQNSVAVVSPFIESSVDCVFVNIGDRVKKDDLLVCLASPEIGILRAEYDKAKTELEIKKTNYERQKKLYQKDIVSHKSFLDAELEKNISEVNYNYALKKLLAMGIKKDEIDNTLKEHSDVVGSTIRIYSPISGIITYRNASIGQKVDNSTKMFEIINLKSVWLEADIFEKDLTSVKINQDVKIKVSAYPEEYFTGKIFYIGSTLNPKTKTIKIYVEIDNKNEKLKPGMYVSTSIITGKKKKALVVPESAVLEDQSLEIVFMKEGDIYHRHKVETGIKSDRFIEILSGIKAGDTIVTKGNFELKSKSTMEGIDPHAGHTH